MNRIFLTVALITAFVTANVPFYKPSAWSSEAQTEINRRTLAVLGLTQSEWDEIAFRKPMAMNPTQDDIDAWRNYDAEYESQMNKWIAKNSKTPSPSQLQEYTKTAMYNLTDDRQIKLRNYNDAIKSGDTPTQE